MVGTGRQAAGRDGTRQVGLGAHGRTAIATDFGLLYPHMSVAQNIGYSLKVAGVASAERTERIRAVARMLELEPLLDRKPAALSGGQRQRVAMGRAMIREPKVFLFDEPLSNLDAKLRVQMRSEIRKLASGLRQLDLLGLENPGRFLDLLKRHGNVGHIFFGHVHRDIAGTVAGIPFTAQRGLHARFVLDLVGDEVVEQAPPSYAVILVDTAGRRVVVHGCDFLEQWPVYSKATGEIVTPDARVA
nr:MULTISPECIES: ATP-binding cassette domain-containing protein [unclassified Mesorhizobium]